MFIINKDKYVLKKFKKISELQSFESNISKNIVERRAKVRICILDDQGYATEQLRALGYQNIDVRETFHNITEFEKYNLVLCDVDGVGTKLNLKKQGLAIAEEISNLYFPQTVVAIFSGKNLSEYDYEENENISIIEKNLSTTELSKKIDDLCSVFWTPTKMWKVLETYFRNEGLSNIEIAILEDAYIDSINKNDYKLFVERNQRNNRISAENIIKIIKIGEKIVSTIVSISHGQA